MKTEVSGQMSEVRKESGSCRWFFESEEAVTLLRKEADTWLYPQPTPFRKFSCAKGPGGGVYCVAFAQALLAAAGVMQAGEFLFPHDDGDYQSANSLRRITKYLCGTGILPVSQKDHRRDADATPVIDPKSTRLAEIFEKIPIFREIRKHRGKTPYNIDKSIFMPGDLLILRSGGLFHMPIMLGGRQFVSAIPGIGVREGDLHDTTYSPFIAGVFRARAISHR